MADVHVRFIVSTILLVLFAEVLITGLVLFAAPRGEWVFAGIDKHGWEALHTFSGMLFSVFALLHFAINWPMYRAEAKASR